MAGFDRSKLKTTSSTALDKQKKEQASKRPSGGGGDRNYLNIEDGVNKIRIFPFHPDDLVAEEDQRYAEAKCTSFLSIERPKKGEDGKVIEGQTELKNFPVFNAKVHGNLSKDPVEEYMNFAKNVAIPNFTSDPEKAKFAWNNIIGYRDAKNVWHSGLKPNDAWVVYAAKLIEGEWKLGMLELKRTVKDQLTELALSITNGENPDPYTDPEDGYVIKIEKTGTGLNTKYKVSIDEKMLNKVDSQKVILQLTDEQLEEWSKLPSLNKLFVNSYKRSDFDQQVQGLQRFDQAMKDKGLDINVFSYDEFLDTLESISNEIGDETPKEEEKPKKTTITSSKPKVEEPKKLVRKPAPVEDTVEDDTEEEESPFHGETTNTSVSDRLAAIKNKYKK
jgi:hypothetical protein